MNLCFLNSNITKECRVIFDILNTYRDGQYEDQHSRPKNSRPNQRRDFNPRGRGGGRGGHHQYGLQSSHRRAEQQQRNQASGGSAPSRSYEEYLRYENFFFRKFRTITIKSSAAR